LIVFDATDNRTYQNQYWLNDAFYKPGGLAIFYDLARTVFRINPLLHSWERQTT